MRICGDKRGLQELGGPKERPQPHRVPRESVDPALLADIPFVSPVYSTNGRLLPTDDGCPLGRAAR